MSKIKRKLGVKGDLALLSAGHLMSDVYASFPVTLSPLWVHSFGLPLSAVGFLVFLRGVSMTVLEPTSGYLADSTAKQMFPLGFLIVALSMSSAGLAPNYLTLILLVLVSTVGHSLFGPQAASAAALSSGERKALGVAVFLAGGSLGAALGPITIAALVNATGMRGTWLMVLPGLVLFPFLHKKFAPREGNRDTPKSSFDVIGLIGSGPALALACVILLRGAAGTGIMAFLPTFVGQKGGDLIAVGATVSLFKLSGAVGAIVAGYLSGRTDWKPFMVLSFVLALPFLYGFLQTDGPLALIFVAFLGATLLSSTSYTLVVAQNLLPGRTSTATGLVFSLTLLGGGVGALCEGFLADGLGVETALLTTGIALPLGAEAVGMGVREAAISLPAKDQTPG